MINISLFYYFILFFQRGIWMWGRTIKGNFNGSQDCNIIIIDTEGVYFRILNIMLIVDIMNLYL